MTQIVIHATKPPEAVLAVLHRSALSSSAPIAGGRDGSFAPAFEVREYADHFTIHADVPGVRSADISVYIENDWITVLGDRPARVSRVPVSYRSYERTFGGFWRAFRLSPGISATRARATLRNGVLSLYLPKELVVDRASGFSARAPSTNGLRVAG